MTAQVESPPFSPFWVVGDLVCWVDYVHDGTVFDSASALLDALFCLDGNQQTYPYIYVTPPESILDALDFAAMQYTMQLLTQESSLGLFGSTHHIDQICESEDEGSALTLSFLFGHPRDVLPVTFERCEYDTCPGVRRP